MSRNNLSKDDFWPNLLSILISSCSVVSIMSRDSRHVWAPRTIPVDTLDSSIVMQPNLWSHRTHRRAYYETFDSVSLSCTILCFTLTATNSSFRLKDTKNRIVTAFCSVAPNSQTDDQSRVQVSSNYCTGAYNKYAITHINMISKSFCTALRSKQLK